jgi:hypothetical protein
VRWNKSKKKSLLFGITTNYSQIFGSITPQNPLSHKNQSFSGAKRNLKISFEEKDAILLLHKQIFFSNTTDFEGHFLCNLNKVMRMIQKNIMRMILREY